jgi:hypothetical protein
MKRNVLISGIIVIILGFASFATAIGLAQYSVFQRNAAISQHARTTAVKIPELKDISSIKVASKDVVVRYEVTNDKPSAQLKTIDIGAAPKVVVTTNGSSLNISASSDQNRNLCNSMWSCIDFPKTLIIRGPAIPNITVEQGSSFEYQATTQSDLTVTIGDSSNMTINGEKIAHLIATSGPGSSLSASNITINIADLTTKADSRIDLGTVKSLSLKSEGSCPSETSAVVSVWNVSDGTVIINGVTKPVESTELACSQINIEGKE